ncbi:16S rRNA (guanine(1207)-N(2))-methyltransferase RsmC [Psychromonas sp. RZ22]|uniref:16S rRNA (guanine(1207)-N(2))-methyltransferase RsmC n=1 Tax=Psychromonas algarum TaxID=2555643 RepID=UPI0010688914|nr:16S rRNA (guanine(1207)-N(2))-methyltransferase RsmC [Psychromonas sp. RZ22]TEW56746.1 16S rRNA (guanine(1207)-N(2))-methyltransferase RsmC [Psychromonas sp. RZ22]
MASSQAFSNPSQVLQRNESLFSGKSILVAGNIDDDYPIQLQTIASSSCFCFNDYRYYDKLKNKLTTSDIHFTDNYQPKEDQEKFDLLLIYIPKAKNEIEYLLANLTPYLKENADIILVGEKKCGIKSVGNLLKPYAEHSNAIDSARHCSIIYGQLSKTVATFDQQQWIKDYQLNLNGISLTICSLPGVFSFGELDKGSELLLNNLPNELTGDGLDFGCGAGVLSCYLLKKNPQLSLDLIDVNVYALASAKLTLEKNALNANVFASDVFSNVQKEYDLLLSNPPFHSGQKTNYEAAETFINQSFKHLKKKGSLTIVANKFLRYEPLLISTYKSFIENVQNNKFKVLSCIK